METYRRLALLKTKKVSKKKAEKSEKTPQLNLMGLRKKIEAFDPATGAVKIGESTKSHQMKLNGPAVELLGLKPADTIDIIERRDSTFLIAKVADGRKLSANKNTGALSVTFKDAHILMKEVAHSFEVSNEVVTAQSEEEKQILGDYRWFILVPVTPISTTSIPEATVAEPKDEKVENKIEEKVAVKDEFF